MKDNKIDHLQDAEHILKWPLNWIDHETHVLCHPENMKSAEIRYLLKQVIVGFN